MISILILTFNSEDYIKTCLDSIFSQSFKDFEVIIVDNASCDNTVHFIRKNYPNIILIENEKNLGAAKARNQAIDIAKGEWILTLDCDTILNQDFFSEFKKILRDLPADIGIVQPKVLQSDKKLIYSTGVYCSWLRRFYDISKGSVDRGQFQESKFRFAACSAAAFYKRVMLEKVDNKNGFFDERFFFLLEDVDLAWRSREKGWKTLYHPNLACYHQGNSSAFNKVLRQFLCWRNRKFMLKKHKISKLNTAMISLCYDFPRLVSLFFTNCYVRNHVLKTKNNDDIVAK